METLFYKKVNYKATTTQLVVFHTPITPDIEVTHRYFKLTPDGTLVVYPGYSWDFGSGPAIDTPPMKYASLPHDIFCQMMEEGMLEWKWKKAVDQYLEDLLESAAKYIYKRKWKPWKFFLYKTVSVRKKWVNWAVTNFGPKEGKQRKKTAYVFSIGSDGYHKYKIER